MNAIAELDLIDFDFAVRFVEEGDERHDPLDMSGPTVSRTPGCTDPTTPSGSSQACTGQTGVPCRCF